MHALKVASSNLTGVFRVIDGVMTFNSFSFATFMLVVFLAYWFIFNRKGTNRLRNIFLLAVSYLFYGLWDWRFLLLIALSSLVDYSVGLAIERGESAQQKRRYLIVSLVANLGMLAVFKYFDFFIESAEELVEMLGGTPAGFRLNWILPVGISFYTFQTLSYTLDVYRGRMKAQRDVVAFFAFVAFFPQLVAGPIERARHLLPQFKGTPEFDNRAVRSGLLLVLWGVFKKVVIADRLALFVNAGYAAPEALDGWTALLVWAFFPWQLYLDFSAYSDIAIGSARMLGFKLTKNFNLPMWSAGIGDFWKRWHITLTRWFREYLFVPVRRASRHRAWPVASLMVVFFATGLWHGASWNFVFWGVFCGLGLAFVDPVMVRFGQKLNAPVQRVFLTGGTILFMYSSLVWFRAPNWGDAMEVFRAFGRWEGGWSPTDWGLTNGEFRLAWIFFIVAGGHELVMEWKPEWEASFFAGNGLKRWAVAWLLLMGLILAGSYGLNIQDQAFIYFQF